MPRIVFLILQLFLLTGIILVGVSLIQKQTSRNDDDTPLSVAPSIQKPGQTLHSQPKPFAHYQSIAQRDLFRTPKDEKPVQAAINIEALKPTALKLKLWGTITGEDGMTKAVIEDQTKRRQAFYRAGEDVSSAKLKMILREKVILSVDGEDQILEMEKPAEIARSTPAVRPASSNTPADKQRPPVSPGPARPKIRLKMSRLGSISEDPEDWSTYAAVTPYKGDDGGSGLILNRVTPSSPLRRLGIRNGDILLSIDEEPVKALEDIIGTLKAASPGEEFSLQIKRRGRERTLDFSFE